MAGRGFEPGSSDSGRRPCWGTVLLPGLSLCLPLGLWTAFTTPSLLWPEHPPSPNTHPDTATAVGHGRSVPFWTLSRGFTRNFLRSLCNLHLQTWHMSTYWFPLVSMTCSLGKQLTDPQNHLGYSYLAWVIHCVSFVESLMRAFGDFATVRDMLLFWGSVVVSKWWVSWNFLPNTMMQCKNHIISPRTLGRLVSSLFKDVG